MDVGWEQQAMMKNLGERPTALNTSDTKHNQLKKKQKQINIQAAPGEEVHIVKSPISHQQLHLL